jgi:hypothetical protein
MTHVYWTTCTAVNAAQVFGALVGIWDRSSLECAIVGTLVRRNLYLTMGLMDWGVDKAELIALLLCMSLPL